MNRWQRLFALTLTLIALLTAAPTARAEGNGQDDLNEALRVKITAEGLRELNKVIELLESSLDKGLDVENSDFAEQLLSESLLQRAAHLAPMIENLPEENLADVRVQRLRAQAVSDLRRVLDYDNPPPQARATLAQLLSLGSDDELTEARDLLDALIDDEGFDKLTKPAQAEAFAMRAPLQADAAKSLADFARAIELAPDEADLRLSRAQFQFQHDDVEGALAEVAAVVEKTPDQLAARLLQSQILRTLKRYDEALDALAKLVELAPSSPLPHQSRGEIYREMGEYDKAVEEFSRVLQIEPGADLALIRRAEALFFANRLDEALRDVDQVLKDNPDLAVAHGLRAQIFAGKNRLPEAIDEMKLLVEQMPGQPDVRFHLALYYQANNQPREAIEAYNEVLKLEADHFLALRYRGDAHLNLGEHAAAIKDFAAALELKPEDTSLLNNYAWVLATSPDDDVRDDQLAIELAERACELTDHGMPHILSTLGAAYAEAGDYDKAIEWLRKGLEINAAELNVASAAADEEQIAQLNEMNIELEKELASYEAKKPWRERQLENGETVGNAAESGPDETPATDAAAAEKAGGDETEDGAAADTDAAAR